MLVRGLVYKTSSQLSFFNAPNNSKSEEFNLKNFEMLADSTDQHWFKQAHVGKI